jgi:hypothetical protein
MSRSTNCPDIKRANPLMAMAPRSQRVLATMLRACLRIRLLRVRTVSMAQRRPLMKRGSQAKISD